jgi:hypothetical protein
LPDGGDTPPREFPMGARRNHPQGNVYRTRDQVVTVEGSHIHEAYIVVTERSLVGFYLPVERTFSPVTPSQTLAVEP